MRPLTPRTRGPSIRRKLECDAFRCAGRSAADFIGAPSAEIVAGTTAPLMRGPQEHFWLMTDNNPADATDFLALSGVDQNRVIRK